MLAYLLAPSFQCVNVNGKPLTGGYIQSFLTGTVTQAITYSDFSGTQNASQVTLDSKGMATIIADSYAALDVYCYNASGVLQWSRQNVKPGSGGGSSQTLIFDPTPTEGSFNPVYSNGIYAAIKNEATARAAADASLQNFVLQNTSDNQKTWYLDAVNGLDTNSGLSRSAPKKTGDAVVIACKTAGKTADRLVVMAGTGVGTDVVTFNAANWANAIFPFLDVVVETAYTQCTWNGITGCGIFKVVGGVHTFNTCTYNGESSVKADDCIVNGGTWSGLMNFDIEAYMTVNGMTSAGLLCIQTPGLEIQSNFAIQDTAKIQADKLFGTGNFGSYVDSEVHLEVQTNYFSFEGEFQFPSQSVNSSIKITAAEMARTATKRLLYLGAAAGVTVNYQLIVDSRGAIVPSEIANPSGAVAGKVIELLKYEDKVDAEIVRATAAEALKEDKSKKNVASGYCPLDENVKIPFANIPDSILGQLEYQGVWDASTGNFPAATEKGQYWIASSNGTGSTISYSVGDWAVYNGTTFDKVDNSDAVFSVNGSLGNVVLEKADVGLGNVDNTSDINKPVSIAQQSALDLKANQSSISNVDNTSDANKPVSTDRKSTRL